MKLYEIVLILVILIWTIIAIKTTIKRPNDIFEDDKENAYIGEMGIEIYPSKTPITNAWIITAFLIIIVGVLYAIVHLIPWTRIVI